MHTTQFHITDHAGLAAKLIHGIRALLGGGGDAMTAALAASCARDIRSRAGLAGWVRSLAALPAAARAAMLSRAAATFRGDWATLGLADSLSRMAGRGALFHATLRELDIASAGSVADFPASAPLVFPPCPP